MPFNPLGPTIGSIPPPLPVVDGGTGAATAAAGLAALGGLVDQASTPVAGTALINGTGAIITWTAPNDGKLHRALVLGLINVVTAETGGLVSITYTTASGNPFTLQMFPPNIATLGDTTFSGVMITVRANTTVSVTQGSALTAGAANVWAEIWAL